MLSQDFMEPIQSPDKHAVDYLVIGGYAVALHGYSHNAKEIDRW